jgi:hypothetical protein
VFHELEVYFDSFAVVAELLLENCLSFNLLVLLANFNKFLNGKAVAFAGFLDYV